MTLDIKVADDSGTWRTANHAWLSDGSAMHQVECGSVYEDGNGFRAFESCAPGVTFTAEVEDHYNLLVTWDAPGADTVGIYINAEPSYVFTTEAGQFRFSRTPNEPIAIYAHAVRPGSSVTSETLNLTMDPVPVPQNFRHTGSTSSTVSVAWDAVPLTEGSFYRIYNDAGIALYDTEDLAYTRQGLPPSTSYPMQVRAWWSKNPGVYSDVTPKVSGSTSGSFPAGTYYFRANHGETYSHGGGQDVWKGTSSGKLWHGDGGAFGAYGNRKSYFFNYRNTSTGQTIPTFFNNGLPVTFTSIRIRMYRAGTPHGLYSPQGCRWSMHNHASKPAGTPSSSSNYHDNGDLGLGHDEWFSLPLSWATHLMQGTAHKGMVWGGTPYYPSGAGYMYGNTNLDVMGLLEFKTA